MISVFLCIILGEDKVSMPLYKNVNFTFYSVCFFLLFSGDINKVEVTVSHAIFAEPKKHSVPVAVTGYRFKHWNLNVLFTAFTPEVRCCLLLTSFV
jgi:hypothetical protein